MSEEEKEEKEVEVFCYYASMRCTLFINGDLIKEFNLNKGDPGKMWGYFYYPESGEKRQKYHIILELSNNKLEPLSNPKLFIYPLYGATEFQEPEGYPVEVEGEFEEYLENHKHYNDREL